jgi:hypothetical protein
MYRTVELLLLLVLLLNAAVFKVTGWSGHAAAA